MKRIKLSEKDVALFTARDKERAAIHEAGHATVAAVLCWKHGMGMQTTITYEDSDKIEEVSNYGVVEPYISRTYTTDLMHEKAWEGTTTTLVLKLDELHRGAVAVAGGVAEELSEDEEITPDEVIQYWQDWLERNEEEDWALSSQDVANLPRSWERRCRAIELAIQLLRDHSTLFESIKARLLEHEIVYSSEIEAMVTTGA